jgi:hypothetical protein
MPQAVTTAIAPTWLLKCQTSRRSLRRSARIGFTS